MSTFYSKGRTAGAATIAAPEEVGNKLVEAEVVLEVCAFRKIISSYCCIEVVFK